MEIDRKELKTRAREAMKQPNPPFWSVTLVYILMTTGLSILISLVVPSSDSNNSITTLTLFINILLLLYHAVVQFGYNLWSLWTSRRLEPGLGALIEGFSVVGRVISMELLIALRLLGWAFLLATGVVMISFGSSSFVLVAASFLAFYAALWAVMLRYALAPYLLADRPGDGAGAAVRRSVELMRGWKMELFKLEFSFLGWQLLAFALSSLVDGYFLWQSGFFQIVNTYDALYSLQQVYVTVTGGALCVLLSTLASLPVLLWLTPYRTVARAGFYDARLQLQQESAPPLQP